MVQGIGALGREAPDQVWRPLTISEQKLLWEFCDRLAAAA